MTFCYYPFDCVIHPSSCHITINWLTDVVVVVWIKSARPPGKCVLRRSVSGGAGAAGATAGRTPTHERTCRPDRQYCLVVSDSEWPSNSFYKPMWILLSCAGHPVCRNWSIILSLPLQNPLNVMVCGDNPSQIKGKKFIAILALSSETTNRSLWGTPYINIVCNIFLHYSEKTDNYFFQWFRRTKCWLIMN